MYLTTSINNRERVILSVFHSQINRAIDHNLLLLENILEVIMRGNHSFNRGPKSIQGRMRALQNLRNVGSKIAVDKEYKEQLWEDGMDYVSQRRAREAEVIHNQFTRQVKNKIVKPKTKDIDALKAWEAMFEERRDEDDLSIPEALEIDKFVKSRKQKTHKIKFTEKPAVRKNYGFMRGVWTPVSSAGDGWHDEYAAAQRKSRKAPY